MVRDEDKKKSGSCGGGTEGTVAFDSAFMVKPVLSSSMKYVS